MSLFVSSHASWKIICWLFHYIVRSLKASMNISRRRCHPTLSMSIKLFSYTTARSIYSSCHSHVFKAKRLITSNSHSCVCKAFLVLLILLFFAIWLRNFCCRHGDCFSTHFVEVRTWCEKKYWRRSKRKSHQARTYCFRTRCRKNLR